MAASRMVEPAAPRPSRSVTWTLAAVLLCAAGLRVWGLGFGLPFGNARPDETYVMDVVRPLLEGRTPPPNYEYPWLYIGLTALGWVGYYIVGAAQGTFQTFAEMPASWRAHPEPFFLVNRGITAACGTLTVWVVFAIGRRLWNTRAGLVAAGLLAVAYLHVRDSHYGTTDVPMTLLVMLSLLLLLHAHDRRGLRGYVWAGAVAGLAGATKYNAVFVVVPLVVSAAIHAARSPGDRTRAGLGRLVAAGLPCGLVAALGIPFAVTDPAGFLRQLQLLFTSTTSGHTHLDLDSGWMTHLQYSLRYGVGVVMLSAAGAGAVAMVARDPARAALVLSFPLSYFAVVGAARNQYFRYVVPLVPFVCLAAAAAVERAIEWLARRPGQADGRVATGIAVALTAALMAEPAARSWQYDLVMARTDNRVLAASWIAEHVAPGSALLMTGSHYGYPWLPTDRGYRFWIWDRYEGRYWSPGDDADRPEWILRQEHPLSADQPVVGDWLRDGYVVAWYFTAARAGDADPTFDRMDAFYLPYAGFDGVTRPGPNFTMFRRAAGSTAR